MALHRPNGSQSVVLDQGLQQHLGQMHILWPYSRRAESGLGPRTLCFNKLSRRCWYSWGLRSTALTEPSPPFPHPPAPFHGWREEGYREIDSFGLHALGTRSLCFLSLPNGMEKFPSLPWEPRDLNTFRSVLSIPLHTPAFGTREATLPFSECECCTFVHSLCYSDL